MRNFAYSFTGGLALISGLMFSTSLPLAADDWAQWRGPNRDGISAEKGLPASWPAAGPKQLWEAPVGIGLSSASVSQGHVYIMGNTADKDSIFCFDEATGKLLWKHEYASIAKDPNGYPGTRCTPTVDGDKVYAVDRHGQFFCLNTKDGKVVWSKDFAKDYGSTEPKWGFSGSALIQKNWVLMEVGGPGASVVAWDKATGKEVWKSGDDPAAYSSLIVFTLGGETCLAQFPKDNFVARKLKDGKELWRTPWKTQYGVNAATPIIQGDELFLSSGYNFGCALLKMTPAGATDVWRNKNMRNHVATCVLWAGHLYGFDMDALKCLDWKTGDVKWETKAYGKGSLILADGKLILFGQQGKLGMAEASPAGFKELASAQVLSGKDTWAHPALANGKLFLRAGEKLACFQLK